MRCGDEYYTVRQRLTFLVATTQGEYHPLIIMKLNIGETDNTSRKTANFSAFFRSVLAPAMVHSQGREEDEMVPNGTKVLYYDIETAPSIAAVWELFSREDSWAVWVEVPRFMLCFSYKWGDEKQVHWVGLPQFALYKEDPHNDLEVVKKLHELFCEADIIIAYNGNAFDHKIANARFLAHGLTPPPPMRQIDPLLIARKEFKLPSNKLEDVGRMLKVGVKFPGHDREMWRQCYHGNLTAWALMKKYNKQDVVLLEKVYLALRPWSSNHPRMVLGSTKACPKCGEKRLQRRGYSIKKTLTYQRWQCQVCGGWCQSRFADKDIESPLVTD